MTASYTSEPSHPVLVLSSDTLYNDYLLRLAQIDRIKKHFQALAKSGNTSQ